MIPDMPPRLAYGVDVPAPQLARVEPGVTGPMVGMRDRAGSVQMKVNSHAPDLIEVVQILTKRVIGCDRPETAA